MDSNGFKLDIRLSLLVKCLHDRSTLLLQFHLFGTRNYSGCESQLISWSAKRNLFVEPKQTTPLYNTRQIQSRILHVSLIQ